MVQTAEQYEFIHRALALYERSLPDQSGEWSERRERPEPLTLELRSTTPVAAEPSFHKTVE